MRRKTGEHWATSPRGRHLRKIARALLRWAGLFAATALLAGAASPMLARELRIRDFHAELDVLPDSSLDVTETIRVQFMGSWNGIYRTIPIEYSGPSGFNYSLFLTDINATDDDERGASLRMERHRRGGLLELKIFVPHAQDAIRTVSLHYRVRNGLRFFEDHDELYWNVTGNDWDMPLESATAHITFPAAITGLRASNFTGIYGSRAQDAQVQILGSNVDVSALRPLAFHEGLTVVAGWDKGFVREPQTSDQVAQFVESNWPLFAPAIAFVLMFWLKYTRGRDPRVGAVAVQYEPPAGLSPGEVGTLVDDEARLRDITATIVDLAVRGYLLIEEREKAHLMGLYSDKDYVFHLKKKPAEWNGAKPHELLLLAGLFAYGAREEVALSELQNKFYKDLPGIRGAIFDSLVKQGYYAHRPDRVRQTFVGAGLIAGLLLFGAGQYIAQQTGMQAQPFVISAILTAMVIIGFGWFMPVRTVNGVRVLHDALGFEDFLGRVEGNRLERITPTPDKFEKYLPFAMALGVEKKWVGAFNGMFTQPPSWYQGSSGALFNPVLFVSSLDAMSTQAGHVMTSAPRSSGSSGFGGGGSSGGGFGGGGGGGF